MSEAVLRGAVQNTDFLMYCKTLKLKTVTSVSAGNVKERDHLGERSVDGRIILKWILKKQDRMGLLWIRIEINRLL
jgi:hypothetical protein